MSDDCLPDCMMPDGGQCCRGYAKQRDRIEALEKHKRLQTEDVMNLGAALGQAQVRIEQLEAALRYFIAEGDHVNRWVLADKARKALAPEQDK